ncbi:MAG: peptidoglycan-binding protein [Chloroflexota bacterium]|nr:peptidoglycan-binding protein [Chloroflexota bacterium]
MRRRTSFVIGAAAVVATVGMAIWVTGFAASADAEPEARDDRKTASVESRTLRVREDLDGVLGHGEERPISGGAPGTLTALPEVGDVIERGGTLFEVDGEPTVLLYGDMPAWRTLGPGMSGPDVQQLEANLVELGFGDGLTVDENWDDATTAAVIAWQEAAGMVADGQVDQGEVVFEPDAVIVAGLEGLRGGGVGPGAPVLRVTDTERVVTASLPASQRDGVEAGDSVEVELGDGSVVEATVTEIDAAPTTAQDGSQTYGMRLALAEADANVPDGPVSLQLVRQERPDVLAVPVNALLALLEGGYAVERVTDDGGTELVAVDAGLFADGWVEVSGDLVEGDEVVVP